MMESIYKSYLNALIEKLTENKNVYYISICDIEYEIIELLRDFKIEGVKIAIINKLDYSTAVKYRNDTSINKIVILTPDSVKKIDSLKDFNEYSIFPEIDSYNNLFWGIIKKIFSLKKDISSKEVKFINLIIKEKQITLSQFFELIDNSIENGEINLRKLSNNLNIVNCWKSNGEFETKLKPLRKLIRLSDPNEIEKRVSIMPIETLTNKEMRIFRQISKFSFENRYSELFSKVIFEDLPEKFTSKPVTVKSIKNSDIAENESIKQYKFSYQAFLEETESITIEEFENEMINMKEQFLESIEEFENEFNNIQDDIISAQVNDIMQVVNNEINIHPSAQKKIISKIEDFANATTHTIKLIRDNELYPHKLSLFCKSTKNYLKAYISLLSFIATNEDALEGLGENEIINRIQNLFITKNANKCKMSFMHPISVLYFNCINDKFKEILNSYNENGSNSIKILLDGILNVNTTRFPINIIVSDGKLYIINENFRSKFAYYEFTEKTQMSSENSLDIRSIANSLKKYFYEFPYKSEISVSIIGNPSFKNIGSLIKVTEEAYSEKITILQRIRIDIISENHKTISKEIDEFYKNENFNNKIQFRLLPPLLDQDGKLNGKVLLNEAIKQSDIVFLFDCYVLYKKEELRKVKYGYNSIFNLISEVGCYNPNEEWSINSSFPIEILWATLHNIYLNKANMLSEWAINELDNTIINLIKTEIDKNNSLMICMITSNMNIIKKIYMKNKFSSKIIRSKGKEFLELTFGSYIKRTHLYDKSFKFSCACSFKNILESILDNSEIEEFVKDMQYEPKEILENLIIEFNYNNEINAIEILCYYPKDENESFNEDEYRCVCKFILNYAFCNSSSHSSLLKSIMVNYLYSSAKNYGDVLLVNHIERYLKPGKGNNILFNIKQENHKVLQDINTTNIRNMIAYIETNSIDERFKTDFKYIYDIDELREISRQAGELRILDNKLLKKIEFILKGEE